MVVVVLTPLPKDVDMGQRRLVGRRESLSQFTVQLGLDRNAPDEYASEIERMLLCL